MLYVKMKLVAALLGAAVSAARNGAVAPGPKVLYGPDHQGRYAVPGEGFIPTKDCTVTADGMRAEFDGRFITFYGEDGEAEGQCEAGERPVARPFHDEGPIHRGLAVIR